MSEDDARLASAVPPPPNCAEEVTSTSTADGSHAPDRTADGGNDDGGNGKCIERRECEANAAKTPPEGDGGETKDHSESSVVGLNVSTTVVDDDGHETSSKGKRKCVQFTTTTTTTTSVRGDSSDMTVRKFIEGDEILDQKNPFKVDDHSLLEHPLLRGRFSSTLETDGEENEGGDGNNDDDDHSSGEEAGDGNKFITKEEILRQSKYVKTYIKNPDKRLNYDKSVIQKLNAIKAQGREVRDVCVIECSSPSAVAVRPPIPAPRAVYQRADRNNNKRLLQHTTQQLRRPANPKPVPRARRDYAEVKVRTGSAEAEESLYDSNEVVQNALKFDSRFRQLEFGSQDDIDTIAEKTETADGIQGVDANSASPASTTPVKSRPVDAAKKSTFAEDVKKSFSNTVKSADFRKYLQSKGLSLVPAAARKPKPAAVDGPWAKRADGKAELMMSSRPETPPRPQTKLSVLTKFLQKSPFTPKTVPHDPAYSAAYFPRSSTPIQYGTLGRAVPGLPTLRNGAPLVQRSISVDAKPKVSFKQNDRGDVVDAAGSLRRPVSVNDYDRTPKLRTGFANRSMTRIESSRRPVKNAGVQVNLANGAVPGAGGRSVAVPLKRRDSWQPNGGATATFVVEGESTNHVPPGHRPNSRFQGGVHSSLQTPALPLYAEPLRENPMVAPGNDHPQAVDSGYHIYEQTPDNLRREMLLGKVGNGQLSNGWHQPEHLRSSSSMQDGGTYGRLRPLYVSSPMSTQSTPLRRRASVNLDREQILNRIYDFCRRSIRNSSGSKSSVHSYQTEPLYQATGHQDVPARVVSPMSVSFPIERPRVQRVQSLTNPRPAPGGPSYMRAVGPARTNTPLPGYCSPVGAMAQSSGTLPSAARRHQHDRNIENVYAFVNKKMNQLNVGSDDAAGSMRSLPTAPSTLRRVTFSRASGPDQSSTHGFDEATADYVNIRGAPDGIQYRTTQC